MTSGFDDDFFGGPATPFDGMGLDDAELFSMFRPVHVPGQPNTHEGFARWLFGGPREDRTRLLDAHIARQWHALPEQSRRRLGVLGASTGTGVSPDDHVELIAALGLIADDEGVLGPEAEFAETYLGTEWVCQAVAEWDRTRCLPQKEKQARRKEQTRLAVAKHRERAAAKKQQNEEKKEEESEARMQAALGQRAIFLDGEGVTLDDGSHEYRYMAAALSDGTVLAELDEPEGITSRKAIRFIADLPKYDQDGVPYLGVFGYGLGYDLTKWIEDLQNKPIFELFHNDDLKPKARCGDVSLLMIGKCLELNDRRAPKGRKKTKVWDILKGFQTTFVKALKAWEVGTPEEHARIEEMKKKRGKFKDAPWGQVKGYCKDECRLGAALTEKYLYAHVEAGIDLRGKYHGAGSTSDAFLMMMGALDKKCTRECDSMDLDSFQQTRSAFSRSFFGGRAEVSRLGIVRGPVWTADIASAYPHVLYELPCVRHGKWHRAHGRGLKKALRYAKVGTVHYHIDLHPSHAASDQDHVPMEPGLVRTSRELGKEARKASRAEKKRREAAGEDMDDVPEIERSAGARAMMTAIEADIANPAWGPLPYRTDKGSIVFPVNHPGGWAWLPEFSIAEQNWPGVVATEAWVLRGHCKCERPYKDIGRYYMLRIEWDKGSKGGSGKGKVLKLGYNGCYGKMAQVIGKNPKYSCRVVAGHITGSTRGRLFEAILSAKDPWNVVYAATDGLISTEKLSPPNPRENETTGQTKKWLGVWEIDPVESEVNGKSRPDDMFIVQPGFWFSTAPAGKARTRGAPLEIIYAFRPMILDQWKKFPTRKPRGLPPQSTFHGAKPCVRPPTANEAKYRRDKLYGRWTEEPRKVNYVVSPKRSSLMDQGDGSYRLNTWWMRPEMPESAEYKKDPSFQKLDEVNDSQPDFVESPSQSVMEE